MADHTAQGSIAVPEPNMGNASTKPIPKAAINGTFTPHPIKWKMYNPIKDITKEINIKIKKLTNIKYDQRLSSNHSLEYKINTSSPIFDSHECNSKFKELTSIRQEIYVI